MIQRENTAWGSDPGLGRASGKLVASTFEIRLESSGFSIPSCCCLHPPYHHSLSGHILWVPTGSWEAPTLVCYPHSSQKHPQKQKSNHVTHLLGPLQRSPLSLGGKSSLQPTRPSVVSSPCPTASQTSSPSPLPPLLSLLQPHWPPPLPGSSQEHSCFQGLCTCCSL